MPRKPRNRDSEFRGDTAQAVPEVDYHEETGEIIEQPSAASLQAKSDELMRQHNIEPRRNTVSMLDPNEWSLDDSQEPYALKDGTEARLRIIEVRKDTRDDESEYLTIRLEVPDEPYSKDVTKFLNIPSRKMDAKQLNQSRHDMKLFCQCFEVDMSRPFDPTEDWVGLEGWAILGVRKTEQYGEQNTIKKLIVPK